MRRLFASGLLAAAILVVLAMSAAAAQGIYGNYFFGTANYSDDERSGYESTMNGFVIGGEMEVFGNIGIVGQFLTGSQADALEVTGAGSGSLDNSHIKAGVYYKLMDMVKVGAGYGSFTYEVAADGYSETRNYAGFQVFGAFEMPIQESIAVKAAASYGPVEVKDTVKGDVGDPGRTADTSYKGSVMDYEVSLSYGLTDAINILAGYRGLSLEGEGDVDHADYLFLGHEYKVGGFFAGVSARF